VLVLGWLLIIHKVIVRDPVKRNAKKAKGEKFSVKR